MKPTVYWKIIIVLVYFIYYLFNFDSKIFLFLFISVIVLILLILLFYRKITFLRLLVPVKKINFLYVLLVLIIIYSSSKFFEFTEKKQEVDKQYFTKEDYQNLVLYRFGYTLYGKGKILNVLYPGMYLTEFYVTKVVPYKKNQNPLPIREDIKNKAIITALSLPKKDLEQDCQIEVFFYGKRFFFPLESKNDFFVYLIKNQAQYFFKIEEKNLLNVDCNNSKKFEYKHEIIDIVKSKISTENAQNLILGLVFGNANWMHKEDKNSIKKLGLLHLFAASGLHLGILFFVMYYPLSKIWGKKHILSYIIPLPFLLLYLWLLNFPFTLIRAYIFILTITLLLIVKRKLLVYDLLLNTLLIMIMIFPKNVVNLSTTMSFLAVGGILLIFRDLNSIFIYENKYPKYNYKENIKYYLYKFIMIQFLITFSASLFLQPLLFFVFKGYPILSPIYNMIYVPIMSIFLPVIFIVIISTMLLKSFSFFDILLNFVWKIIDYFIIFIIKTIHILSNFSLWIDFKNSLNLGFIISILLVLAVLLLLSFYKKNRIIENQFRNYFFIVYGIYIISLFIIYGLSFFK
jgi:ComEC/Rec2-related protein